ATHPLVKHSSTKLDNTKKHHAPAHSGDDVVLVHVIDHRHRSLSLAPKTAKQGLMHATSEYIRHYTALCDATACHSLADDVPRPLCNALFQESRRTLDRQPRLR